MDGMIDRWMGRDVKVDDMLTDKKGRWIVGQKDQQLQLRNTVDRQTIKCIYIATVQYCSY